MTILLSTYQVEANYMLAKDLSIMRGDRETDTYFYI